MATGVAFAEMGNDVCCVDVDASKIAQLQDGRSTIYEPGLDALLAKNIQAGRLMFTTKAAEAVTRSQLLFIAVGTPPNADGSADLTSVLTVAETIAEYMDDYKVVINKSTVPVGTFLKVKSRITEILLQHKKKIDFDVCSNPEFLREGMAIEDCLKPSRVIVGVDSEKVAQLMRDLYGPFLKSGNPFIVMDPSSSEMTKYAANAMLAAKISLMNEFSRVCEKIGADIESVREGLGADPRIGPEYLFAGIGYGGSCFPKDVRGLVHVGETHGEKMEILCAVERVNASQGERFFRTVETLFSKNLQAKKIAVWGASFKPGTDDLREAPAMSFLEKLLSAGADVKVFDPAAAEGAKKALAGKGHVEFSKDQYSCLEMAEALVILTEWESFRAPDFQRMKSSMQAPLIIDGRNIYIPAKVKAEGFEYISVGRPT